MRMPIEELISQGEAILTKYQVQGLEYLENGGGDSVYGLATQLEHCMETQGTDQRQIIQIMIDLYKISEKMGNPLATEQLMLLKHHLR